MSTEEAAQRLAQLPANDDVMFFEALERVLDSYLAEHPEAIPEVQAVLARITERREQR